MQMIKIYGLYNLWFFLSWHLSNGLKIYEDLNLGYNYNKLKLIQQVKYYKGETENELYLTRKMC